MKIKSRLWLLLVTGLCLLASSQAVNERSGDWPWCEKLHGFHDAEVAEALGTGWFLNVGPTGIRARIPHDHPEYFKVEYVFKKSPAAGLVDRGDYIVGANGTKMKVAHEFGRHKGWEGPMMEMAKLIEDSQGKDGKLELIIWPGGNKGEEKTVTVQIEAVGRFSPTYPFNCPRSDKLQEKLCDFLEDEYKRAGTFEAPRPHTFTSCLLALMAKGDGKYDSLVDGIMRGYRFKEYDATKGDGFPAWGQVYDGIAMGEYYLLKNDKQLQKPMESLADCLNDSVWPTTGGLSHRPFAFIQRRMAEGGPKGYGAMAMPAGLGMLALSLFKEAGLPHAEASYQRIHEGYLCSVGGSGEIGYGFSDWDHATIELKDKKGPPANSPRGIGFECLDGMKGIGEYTVLWPTKSDPRYRPTDWLRREVETNRVFDKGGNQRLVIRNMAPEEPSRKMPYTGGLCGHFGRSGAGALAHKIGNADNPSWGYLADLLATGCANSPENLLNGHASTHHHVMWGSLGAALADPKDFRKYMDYIKWWMIMAETHDGGYVVMPGRDYASTDHVYGTRCYPTACAALILAVKDKRLRITGRPPGAGMPKKTSRSQSASRKARDLPGETRVLLDEMLRVSLREMNNAGLLAPLPMELSKARTKVWLSEIDKDLKLHFKALQGESEAVFFWDELSHQDHAMLAALVARLRQDDAESQAMAGVYMEGAGDVTMAERYYKRAGAELADKINTIFE